MMQKTLKLNSLIETSSIPRYRIYSKYNRLTLSRSLKDSVKYSEISVPRHIRFAELRIKQAHFTNEHVIWLQKLEIYWKYCGKEKKLLLRSKFLLFSTKFCYLLLDFHVQTGTRFSLRDKRLFEISEVEITIVDCICTDRPERTM